MEIMTEIRIGKTANVVPSYFYVIGPENEPTDRLMASDYHHSPATPEE